MHPVSTVCTLAIRHTGCTRLLKCGVRQFQNIHDSDQTTVILDDGQVEVVANCTIVLVNISPETSERRRQTHHASS